MPATAGTEAGQTSTGRALYDSVLLCTPPHVARKFFPDTARVRTQWLDHFERVPVPGFLFLRTVFTTRKLIPCTPTQAGPRTRASSCRCLPISLPKLRAKLRSDAWTEYAQATSVVHTDKAGLVQAAGKASFEKLALVQRREAAVGDRFDNLEGYGLHVGERIPRIHGTEHTPPDL